jgi:hypothetical protein
MLIREWDCVNKNGGSLKESVVGHSDEFFAFKPQRALFFVIPAFAGMANGGQTPGEV